MPATCVITGYKLTAGTLVVYGFILSGTVFNPPTPTPTTNVTQTTEHPTVANSTPETTEPTPPLDQNEEYAECGTYRKSLLSGPRTLDSDAPLTRLLLSMLNPRRILNGFNVNEGDYPWIAYLYEKFAGRQKGFFCGGSLINDQWIVTAAHCISQPNSPEVYGVVLGEHDSSKPSSNEKDLGVIRIIRHNDFFGSSFNNDIALMKLSQRVLFTKFIRPVCLVPKGYPTDATKHVLFEGNPTSLAGGRCTVLGWGETENGSRSDILQQLDIVIVPRKICLSSTSRDDSRPYHGRSVGEHEFKFCAGGSEGQDTCAGDSGGPLVCPHEDDKYYLHGLTSYGTIPCGQNGLPGVYTKMADFYDWIMDNVD